MTQTEEEAGSSETTVRVGISLLERGGLLARHFDVPRSAFVSWAGANGHELPADCGTFIAAAQLRPRAPQNVDLVALAPRLQLAPDALEERLLSWRDAGLLEYRGGPRQMLLELLPAPPDATQRLQDLLDTMQEQREEQIERLADYARSSACRHKTIARHFAEALRRTCGVCDRCAPASDVAVRRLPRNSASNGASHAIARSIADDTLETLDYTILSCLISLQFGVGKSGLARTLTGSIAAPSSCKRSAYYGRLDGMKVRTIENAIEHLVKTGYLERQEDDPYRLLTLTMKGKVLVSAALAGDQAR